MHWDSKHYLKFEDERTRPASDLVARIALERPRAIVDLGCGPGNSTAVLRARWPDADITGLDNSSDMLDAARKAHPETKWMLGDAAKWSSSTPIDLVFSNAALQWVSDHRTLMPHLLLQVAADGALAFQIPSATFAAVRTHIHELSKEPAWKQRMTRARAALTMEEPGFYYDCLVPHASRLDIWETEYHHIMPSPKAIIDWMSSTGLRPFMAALDDHAERQRFLHSLQERVDASYAPQSDGKVLFPFRRLFVIAYR